MVFCFVFDESYTMKFYYSPVPGDLFDFSGAYKCIANDGTVQYCTEYVEVGSNPGGIDDVIIGDAIGRSVPVDVESIPQLIEILEAVLDIVNATKLAEAALEEVYSNEAGYLVQ